MQAIVDLNLYIVVSFHLGSLLCGVVPFQAFDITKCNRLSVSACCLLVHWAKLIGPLCIVWTSRLMSCCPCNRTACVLAIASLGLQVQPQSRMSRFELQCL